MKKNINWMMGCWLLFSWLQAVPVVAQETGTASYYADKYHGTSKTASGEMYDKYDFTAAHRSLPFNTWVAVTNLSNGNSTRVRINDRGPFKPGRILDVSRIAAETLGMIGSGVAQVKVEVISAPQPSQDPAPFPSPSPSPEVEVEAAPRPTPAPVGTLNDLPIVDEMGRPIRSTSPSQPQSPIITDEGRNTAAPIGLEDAQRYTPALFRMVAFKEESFGYGIQVGAYFNVYRLFEAMNALSDEGYQNTLVQSTLKGDQPVFRILIGPYPTRSDAVQVQKSLGRKGKKGIILDLSTLR
jgi:rare lipoprotein A (peptidoglycan hydrolase)